MPSTAYYSKNNQISGRLENMVLLLNEKKLHKKDKQTVYQIVMDLSV